MVLTVIGQRGATACIDTEVAIPIAVEVKVLFKTAVMQHAVGITAHREHPAFFNEVVFIQHKNLLVVCDAALHNLRRRVPVLAA